MKKALLHLLLLLAVSFTQAQETFDMPGATGTYLTGINDSGEICGYYTIANGNTLAFEINKYGDTIKINPGSYSYCTATGISNKGMVVGNFGTSSATAQGFIFLPNAGRNAGGSYNTTITSTWGGTNTTASGITDDTCIAGSYQVGGNDDGALMCKSYAQVNDLRCSNVGTVYPTFMYDLDINGNVGGFIIQGATEQAAIYRGVALGWDTFKVGGNIKSRILGMNDNGWVCGNYASTTKGFYCKKLPGQNYTNFVQVIVLDATTIYPSDINNDTDVVGFFTDAQGIDHGFLVAKYDIGFKPGVNGFAWENVESGMWPSSYYSQFDYTTDPYLKDGSPFPTTGPHPHPWLSQTQDEWPDAIKACQEDGFYVTVNGKRILKDAAYQKWKTEAKQHFQGVCFGCSYASLLVFENFAGYSTLFPANANLSNLTAYNFPKNNDVLASLAQLQAREVFAKEMDTWNTAHAGDKLSETMQYLSQSMRNSRGRSHSAIGYSYVSSGGHSILPYRMVPGKGGNGVDSIFVYDSQYPGQSGLFITVDLKGGGWHYDAKQQQSDVGVGRMKDLTMSPPDNYMLTSMHLAAAQGPRNNYARSAGFTTAFYNDNSRVIMTDDNNAKAYMAIDSNSRTTLITPRNRLGGIDSVEPSRAIITSNLTTVNKVTLTDTVENYLGIYDDDYLIKCQRTDGTATTDNYIITSGNLTYNNTGTTPAAIGFIMDRDDSAFEYGYTITGLTVAPGSKTTVGVNSTTGMVLQNFGPAGSYVITTRFLTSDSIITYTGTIPISGNTQHIIQTHDTTYSGIYILVDTGMTGHYEDTIFVHQTVADVNHINAPSIIAWPVPTANLLYMSGPEGLVKYIITDALGRTTATGQVDFGNGSTQKFDVGSFAQGAYTITGTGKQGKWTYMFVKE